VSHMGDDYIVGVGFTTDIDSTESVSGWIGVVPLHLGYQIFIKDEERREKNILVSDCEAPILDWKGHQRSILYNYSPHLLLHL